MESNSSRPTAREASAALTAAEASRARLAEGIRVPSWFASSLGAAIATQIATTAAGVRSDDAQARWTIVAGLVPFLLVAAIQLVRFRRLNGVWLGGFLSRVVLGSGNATSAAYALALAVAIWAALGDRWWLVAAAALAGGCAYALLGRRWLRAYRADPAGHGRGEPLLWVAALALAAVAGLALLVLER